MPRHYGTEKFSNILNLDPSAIPYVRGYGNYENIVETYVPEELIINLFAKNEKIISIVKSK